MPKGFAFKLLPPKDIAKDLSIIGSFTSNSQSAVNTDAVDRPTSEGMTSFLQMLVDYAYGTESQQVLKLVPNVSGLQHADIYEEAAHALLLFRCGRCLTDINYIDDFSLKDIWEPSSKRARAILSAMTNFCRYKESRWSIFEELREEVQKLDKQHCAVVSQSTNTQDELNEVEDQLADLNVKLEGTDVAVQGFREQVNKLGQEKQIVDAQVSTLERNLGEARAKVEAVDKRIESVRSDIGDVQAQIAEHPQGIEADIAEQQVLATNLTAQLAEKSEEKRCKLQREHRLTRIVQDCASYKAELDVMKRIAERDRAARAHTSTAREKLELLKVDKDAGANENTELELSISQAMQELERAKSVHADRLHELDARRQRSIHELQELRSKQTDEQTKLLALDADRHASEVEIDAVQRTHEMEMEDLRRKLDAVKHRRESYEKKVHDFLSETKRESAKMNHEIQGDKGASKADGVFVEHTITAA